LAVHSAVDSAVGSAVGSAVDSAVRSAVGSAVDLAVDLAVGSAVRSAVRSAVEHLLRCAYEGLDAEWYANLWPGWTAWRTFFRDHCDLEIAEMDALAAIEAIDARAGAVSLWRDFAMVSDRPRLLRRDAGGQLHAADGPAIAWRDGWDLYFWHGQRIPRDHQWMIDRPREITPDRIEAEPNAELRRIALEIFGFERYLAARSARELARDELHGQPRRLLEIMVAGAPVRIVEVVNGSLEPDGTRRRYHLGAMPGATPHEAIAASYGIAPRHYREAVRT
jgi:hypothetical protein